jgi:hypothetical protein
MNSDFKFDMIGTFTSSFCFYFLTTWRTYTVLRPNSYVVLFFDEMQPSLLSLILVGEKQSIETDTEKKTTKLQL